MIFTHTSIAVISRARSTPHVLPSQPTDVLLVSVPVIPRWPCVTGSLVVDLGRTRVLAARVLRAASIWLVRVPVWTTHSHWFSQVAFPVCPTACGVSVRIWQQATENTFFYKQIMTILVSIYYFYRRRSLYTDFNDISALLYRKHVKLHLLCRGPYSNWPS